MYVKNYRPTMNGLGDIVKNMSIFGTFFRSAGDKNGRQSAILNLMKSVLLNYF